MFHNFSKICIFGISGTGKSYLCRNLQNYFNNNFIFDTLNEYTAQDGMIFNDYLSFSNYVIQTQNQNGLKAIFQFPLENSQKSELFDECIRLLYYRGKCNIVIEEVQNFASVHTIPPFLKQASLTGRHQEVSFITTTQRVAEIHKSLLSQAHHIYCGYTDSPTDLKTLREFGFNDMTIANLNDREFIWKHNRDFVKVSNNLDFL